MIIIHYPIAHSSQSSYNVAHIFDATWLANHAVTFPRQQKNKEREKKTMKMLILILHLFYWRCICINVCNDISNFTIIMKAYFQVYTISYDILRFFDF